MQTVQLTTNEVKMIEGMKKGIDIQKVATEIGVKSCTAYSIIRNLIALGVVIRTGEKMNYSYTFKNVSIEIVKRRKTDKVNEVISASTVNKALSEKQIAFYEKNKTTMTKMEIARKIGLTKIELNFALINAGIGKNND